MMNTEKFQQDSIMTFDSILNFRPLGGNLSSEPEKNEDGNEDETTIIYRSGTLDTISQTDIISLKNRFGIKHVYDLRNFDREYLKADAEKLLDVVGENEDCVPRLSVVNTQATMKSSHIVYKDLSKFQYWDRGKYIGHGIQHTFIDFFNVASVFQLMKQVCSFAQGIKAISLIACDLIVKTNYFKPFFVEQILNKAELTQLYQCMVDYNGVAIVAVLRLLNESGGLPCVICCQHGKDRTGVLSAILLSLLGYTDEQIANDYAMSEICVPPSHPSLNTYSETLRGAKKETMLALLKHMREIYGSVQDYLASIGFMSQEQSELIEKLQKRRKNF